MLKYDELVSHYCYWNLNRIVLILLYFYSLKMYKKQKGKELSQQKQGSIKLQEQIDTFQTMIEENENLHSLEQEKP